MNVASSTIKLIKEYKRTPILMSFNFIVCSFIYFIHKKLISLTKTILLRENKKVTINLKTYFLYLFTILLQTQRKKFLKIHIRLIQTVLSFFCKNIAIQKKITIIIIMSITFLSLFCKTVQSHPHVFIVQYIKISFDDKGLEGFNIQWYFDDMYTSMIVNDYDKNQNKILEKNEVAVIKKEAFSYLSNYNYFIFIKIDNKPFAVKFIKNFSAKLQKGKLIYEFFVPCHVSAIKSAKHIVVATYDPTYYSAVFFAKNSIELLNNANAFEIKTVIKEDKSTLIYFDMINPMALFLDFRIKQ